MNIGHREVRNVVALTTMFIVTACSGGGGGGNTPPVINPPLPPPPTAVNVNTANPTLVVADNTPIFAGGTLNLVWSDEFDAAQLDPEMWFLEEGDGSQYGIPGWGNNELQWYLPDSA